MGLNNIINNLWTEKYRPSKLSEYVGNEEFKSKMQGYIDEGEIPSLLLYGAKPGTGKTSAAKLIANHLDCDFLYINASSENNVDTIRNKVTNFVSTIGFKKWKIVILDECLEKGTLVFVLRSGAEIQIPIEDLDEDNDLVKSYDIKTNKIEWQPFKFFDKGYKEIWEIQLENNEIVRCTAEHKWFVYNDNNEVIVIKTDDLHNYNYILSPY